MRARIAVLKMPISRDRARIATIRVARCAIEFWLDLACSWLTLSSQHSMR